MTRSVGKIVPWKNCGCYFLLWVRLVTVVPSQEETYYLKIEIFFQLEPEQQKSPHFDLFLNFANPFTETDLNIFKYVMNFYCEKYTLSSISAKKGFNKSTIYIYSR